MASVFCFVFLEVATPAKAGVRGEEKAAGWGQQRRAAVSPAPEVQSRLGGGPSLRAESGTPQESRHRALHSRTYRPGRSRGRGFWSRAGASLQSTRQGKPSALS